jgi:cytochrome c oxidase subunit 2
MTPLLHLLLAAREPQFWLPPQGSTTAGEVDAIFDLILWISLAFFALIVGLMVAFVIRYRARRAGQIGDSTAPRKSTPLELVWSGIPLVIVIVLFWVGFESYMDLRTPPANAYEVNVIGMRWRWQFEYPNGWVEDKLHVPADRPVRLVMTSEDVIHSLAIPDFRVKMDVVPGRYTEAWFRAPEPGTYRINCTEYCGEGHSDMLSEVVVHPPGEFEKWLEDASSFVDRLPPAEAGEKLYEKRGCIACHSKDGRGGVGPTFQGLYGRKVVFRDGSSLVADENYIRESIFEPGKRVVAGFEAVMPSFQGRLKDKDVTAIIAFIKSLGAQ